MDDQRRHFGQRSRRNWIPYIVLLLGIGATGAAAAFVNMTAEGQDRARFSAAVERTRIAIANRTEMYGESLRSITVLFQTAGIPRKDQFHGYLSHLDIPHHFPGIAGIGFSAHCTEKDKEGFLKFARQQVNDRFQIWPDDSPRGEYNSILYVEPENKRTAKYVGFDMHTDPVRAAAMDAARDQAAPVASARVKLIQDEGEAPRQVGFFIYMPVYYKEGGIPVTLQQRRAQLRGYVFAPFRADELLRGIFLGDPQSSVDFQIYDGKRTDAAALLHDSSKVRPQLQQSTESPRFSKLQTVHVAGRPWTLRVFTRPEFEKASSRWLVPLIIVAGSLISLTFFAITRSQVRAAISARRAMEGLQQSEGELRQAKETAEAANMAKDKFLAMLSHELRTPLAPVLATAGMRRNDLSLPLDVREDMNMIDRNIHLEARLIDDLLDVTRISRGKLQLQKETVDAHEVLRHSIELVEQQIPGGKNVAIEMRLDAQRHHVRADPARLQQMFCNLLLNAMKFTPRGGVITAQTSNEGETIRTEITDTGIGIDQELMPKLFEPFEQSELSSRRFGGLGLGLSIVKGLVEAHGGRIEARSEGPNQGATFTLWLDTVDAPVPQSETHVSPPALVHQKLRVLVVEDHPDTLRAMTRLLRSFGHDVHGAPTAADALARCQKHTYDVLISDIGLPDKTGYELLPQLRASPNGTTFKGIALTGFGMPEDVQLARDAGFEAHLTKPIDPTTLEATINRLSDASLHADAGTTVDN